MKIDSRLRFEKTCSACPEQYDVFLGDEQVAYIRVRWGDLRVECPDVFREEVYFSDDVGYGRLTKADREYHWPKIVKAIEEWVENR